jgi:D-tyrosyl-tRNA(Tyr) deacylase
VRGLVQRVERAAVSVDGELVGRIGRGLVALIGVTHDDDVGSAAKMAAKLWNLRVFEDTEGKMNLSVAETSGQLLVISQFTLYGDTRRGRRPSWIDAAPPDHAEPLITELVARLRDLGADVETGVFRAHMSVELVNDGPVTLMVETGSATV